MLPFSLAPCRNQISRSGTPFPALQPMIGRFLQPQAKAKQIEIKTLQRSSIPKAQSIRGLSEAVERMAVLFRADTRITWLMGVGSLESRLEDGAETCSKHEGNGIIGWRGRKSNSWSQAFLFCVSRKFHDQHSDIPGVIGNWVKSLVSSCLLFLIVCNDATVKTVSARTGSGRNLPCSTA